MLNIVLSEIDALVVVNKIIKLLNQHIKINRNWDRKLQRAGITTKTLDVRGRYTWCASDWLNKTSVYRV